MAGGIHPPLEAIASWPKPNYDNPASRNGIVPLLAVFMVLSVLMVSARIAVRGFMQRNMGVDDWLILVAMVGSQSRALQTMHESDSRRFPP